MADRRERRQRRRLVSRLAQAEKLRASRYFTELDYALVAVGVLAELDDETDGGRERLGRFEGKSWQVPEWVAVAAFALETDDPRPLGPYGEAPAVVARHVPRVAGGTPDGYGGWVADLTEFHWTPELTKRVADVNRRRSFLRRRVWSMENALTRFNEHYPHVFSATGALLAIILASALAYLLGQRR